MYGIGLGPGDPSLLTIRGKTALESVSTVYTPGRLSRAVVSAHVSDDRLGSLSFPMTRDPETLRTAWKEAANRIAAQAQQDDVAFVTLGDPNVYSTFGHLRRTLAAFHPAIDVEVVPGVSAVTAFTSALGVELTSTTGLTLCEAANGPIPTDAPQLLLFKLLDVPSVHEQLSAANYDVWYGRRLFMESGPTVVTDDPTELADRDYYTLAFARKRSFEATPATAAFTETHEVADG